jgi:altronate dehydratase small subunit
MCNTRLTGLKVNDLDNVATLFCNANSSCEVEILDKQGRKTSVMAIEDIPYGHKIALRNVKRGEPIIKYGEQIGIATSDIRIGQHVHVHNIESVRGRGDWTEEVKVR